VIAELWRYRKIGRDSKKREKATPMREQLTEWRSVMHSWCVQDHWDAPEIVGGHGAEFWDRQGHRYLDMSSLAECSNLGHQHPQVIRAIKEQADRLCFITSEWGAEPRRELADMLLDVSGFEGGRVFFTLAGADANENAVKFARWASDKPNGQVLARSRSYHGASNATMNYSGDPRGASYPELERVVRVAAPYCYRCPFGHPSSQSCGRECVHEVGDAIDRVGADQIAAVLMESHAGTNGIVPPADYWPTLLRQCRERQVILIADEVMAGFGRTGTWFGWQHAGEAGRPDMMTLAKGLTGAHIPLGAVVVSEAISVKLQNRMLYTGLTYCGHPLSCAAGVAALKAYTDQQLIQRSAQLGQYLFSLLGQLQQRHPIIGDVRGQGLFAIVELVKDRASRAPIVEWGKSSVDLRELVRRGRELGVSFAVRSNLIVIAPPLIIENQQLERAVAVLDQLLTDMAPALSAVKTA
jgi:taurine--2-oxoglutarate transaminase